MRSASAIPVLVRPSYVLGGRAMVIAYDADAVRRYMGEAVEYSQERPVLVDHFLEDAVEVDVDALCDGRDVVIAGIMQHIEEAGIHSGDSSCVLPAADLAPSTLETIRTYTRKLALALNVVGLVNLQFAIQRRSGEAGSGVRHRGESTCFAHRSLRLEGDRGAAGQDRGAADDRPHLARVDAGAGRRAHGSRHRHSLFREVAGLSLEQVSWRRHGARPGDEVDRRSDGCGR